jgi:hypothetical protein
LPPYLLKIKLRGKTRFRFKTKDGRLKTFPIETTETQAIQAAIAYNRIHRDSFDLESAAPTRAKDRFDKPLKDWIPIVIKRVTSEEGLSRDVLTRFVNECKTLCEHLGDRYTKSLTLADINNFLNDAYAENQKRTFNGKVSNLKKVFSYLADESAIDVNFMVNKKLRKVTSEDMKKSRKDLSARDFELIYQAAPLYLKVAMSLSLQTTHAVREIYRIKYKIKKAKPGLCGIVWHDTPKIDDGNTIYGTLYIHREKVKKTESSFVAIPVNDAIKEIVELSRTDRLHCPYVVHRKPTQSTRGIAKDCDHAYQVHHQLISKAFSKVRDEIGLYAELDKAERPTYHEIRRLSAKLIEAMGESPTVRMAHANERTTKLYTGSDEAVWNEVSSITVKTS